MARERIHRKLFATYLLVIAVALLGALIVGPWRPDLLKSLLVGAFLSVGAAAALAIAAERTVGQTLSTLRRAVQEIASGRTLVEADLPRGGADDELDELAYALGNLSRRLGEQRRALTSDGDKLRTVLDGMSEGVALLTGGRVAFANPAFHRLLDARPDVEGRTPLEVVRRQDLAEAIAMAGRGTAAEAKDIVAPGGRVLQLRAEPLAAGAAVVVLLDVTEARSLERMRREFVANASHELRTPVAAIAAVAETLISTPGMAAADRARFERILWTHAGRLGRLVSDLLDLSRAEASGRPRLEPVDLGDPLASALAAVRERADTKQLQVEVKVPPELPPLAADATALEQVLVNLLDNAVKYTEPGGRVEVRAAVDGGGKMVRIAVADTGPGIAAEHLPRLFERFYRVDPARSRELGGTGLGLAIVKHLVQAHGGDAEVTSTVGKGTTFQVTFPVSDATGA